MAQYIDKDALVAEIEKRIKEIDEIGTYLSPKGVLTNLLCHLNTLEVKEVQETVSIAYVVTRSEEHSDYVEKVFFDEDKAREYCDRFNGNEDEYARDITRVKVTL